MFCERLLQYRNSHNLKMKDMADKLHLSESYYSLIENGKRTPSKKVIEKLVFISELPEEYWVYGVDKDDYINIRKEFKSIKKALDTILELNPTITVDEIFDKKNNPIDSLGKLMIAALKSDLSYLIQKKKK